MKNLDKYLNCFFICITLSLSCVQSKKIIKYPAVNKDNYSPGKEWQLVWADEFSGKSLNLKNWTRQKLLNPYNEEWEEYHDSKKNSYVKDGYLVLKAIHISDRHGPGQYTSARLHTGGKQTWKYGKITARIQLPYGKGIWPAFWMLGANSTEVGGDTPWPKCGEIDILELYGFRDNAVVEANIHYDDKGHNMLGAISYKLNQGIFAEKFHVFEIEWNSKKIIWSVDGKKYASADIDKKVMSELHKEFYILLNISVGGKWAGRPDKSTVFPQYMYVDWVRVYQK